MMSTALMLCGISPNLIGTYNKIMGYVKSVTEDLFFFIFVFFAVGFCIWVLTKYTVFTDSFPNSLKNFKAYFIVLPAEHHDT